MRRLVALAMLVVALVASLLVAAGPAAAADPPPNPSNSQISAAQQARQVLAAKLGSLQARAAELQGQIFALQASADAAIVKYQQTTQAVVAAVAAADRAKTELDAANAKVDAARTAVQIVARDAYVTGNSGNRGAALLFTDNADVEFTIAATTYLAQRRDDTLDTLTVANVAASNAETDRRDALALAETLQKQADAEQQEALASLGTAQGKQAELNETLAVVNQQAATAAAQLSSLLDKRKAYDAYLAEVARKAAAAAEARRVAQAAAVAAAARQNQAATTVIPPAPAASPSGTWALPLRTYRSKSSNYGYRCSPSCGFHYGIDISAFEGTPMYAVGPGTVVASGPASGFGNWVVIRHSDDSYSVYGHMRVLVARVGQQVTSSTLIAYVGSEGQSTGAHLHFEVRLGSYYSSGNATNPIFWLAARGIDF